MILLLAILVVAAPPSWMLWLILSALLGPAWALAWVALTLSLTLARIHRTLA